MVVLAAIAVVPTQAHAEPILQQRCNADSLDVTQGALRVEWARKCGLLKNVGSPTFGFDTGLPASTGGNLIDYQEADPGRNPYGEGAFSGPSQNFEVNYAYVNALYLSGGTSQGTDTWGYQKWSRADTRKRARPLYPTFGSTSDLANASNVQLWPHPTLADCNLYADRAGSMVAQASTYYVNGYCEASCYAPDQRILFADGYTSILDALNARREDLMTLTPDSSLDDVKLQQNTTYSYTAETRDTEHPLYVITTQSGGELRVTNEHPVINGEGRMVQAQTLKVGDDLVKADGTPDSIVDIQKTSHFGKVYNLRPVTQDLVSNVLVAQGYLVGSSNFQNDDVAYINRIILFRSMPSDVIP
ncbi:Hint domain-containing protein [Archangium gephyra]|uniref:cell surface protein n=1 Tax=Archangium gephyra TaxID=48 RepID=UPI0035D4AB02